MTVRAWIVGMAMGAFLCNLGGAEQAKSEASKRPMTFADLMALKRISDPQASPSGKWVLFSATDVSLEKNTRVNHLWVVGIDRQPQERQVTFSDAGESNGRFSPDGKWISYTATGADGRQQIFIARWDDEHGGVDVKAPFGAKARAVTALETEADGAIWAPDSKHVLFTSSVYPGCESHLPPGLDHNADEAKCNADRDAVEAKNPVKARLFTALFYRHWNQFTGPKRSHVFYAAIPDHLDSEQDPAPMGPTDLTPASVVGDHEAPTFSLGGPLGYAISPDGKEIAYEVNLDKVPAESTNNDVFVLKAGADPKTAKKVSTSPGSDDGPQYSPDGKWLAWRSQARNGYESDKFDLVVLDRQTGKLTNLTSKFDGWVDEFHWVGDSQHLLFASALQGAEPLFEVNVTGDDLKPMTKGGGEWGDFTPVLENGRMRVVGVRQFMDHPAAVFNTDLLSLDASAARVGAGGHAIKLGAETAEQNKDTNIQLSHINGSVTHVVDLAAPESFWFGGANGTKVEGFLVKPPNFDPAKKYPLKFLMHGGPQGAWGDAWSYRWNPELFAADGYVVVMINPRGSTGYGQKFLEEVSGDWGGRAYEDLMKGLDYAEQRYPFIDKTRECALGASYGGFMANWVLTHTNRFKCIVTHDGMYNPQSAFGSTEELWFNEWEFRPLAGSGDVRAGAGAKAGPPPTAKDDKEKGRRADAVVEQDRPAHPWDFYDKPASEDPFRKWSPMLNIRNAHTPTLVVHSQRDYRLDVSEGMQLFTALQLLGVPSEMLYFPDEGHWVLKPKNSELWYKTVNDWCDRWTGKTDRQ